jgi:spore maturation protein CgeB
MNILLLTKINNLVLDSSCKTVEDYTKLHHFFNGFDEGFKKLGYKTFLNCEESFFIPEYFYIKFNFFSRAIRFIFRKTRFYIIDRYFFSIKIALFCKRNNINIIFTEINTSISPKIIKKFYKNITITQWFGILPDMTTKDVLNHMLEYDILWTPGKLKDDIYQKSKLPIQKFKYIGSGVNLNLLKHEYDDEFAYDVVFVGGCGKNHNNRIEILEKVAEKFDSFAFYGYGIENVPDHYLLKKKYKGWINPVEQRKLYSSSKIALNLMLDNYERFELGFNQRLFEIAACRGAMQICRYDNKIKNYFDIGKDLECFDTIDNLIDKINFYLLNKKAKNMLVNNSYLKVKKYSYSEKVKKMMTIMNNESK